MKIKDDPSVKVDNLNSAMLVALIAANDVWKSLGVSHGVTITSGNEGHPDDSIHSYYSLHYPDNTEDGKGWAVDLRIWDVNPELAAERLRAALPNHYDIIVESHHIHVEYDPDTYGGKDE